MPNRYYGVINTEMTNTRKETPTLRCPWLWQLVADGHAGRSSDGEDMRENEDAPMRKHQEILMIFPPRADAHRLEIAASCRV